LSSQQRILDQIADLGNRATEVRIGVVTVASPLTIKLGGSGTAIVSPTSLVTGLAVDDVVTCLTAGGDIIVIGSRDAPALTNYTYTPDFDDQDVWRTVRTVNGSMRGGWASTSSRVVGSAQAQTSYGQMYATTAWLASGGLIGLQDALIPIYAADLSGTGKTAKFRIRVTIGSNATGPGYSFTSGLYPYQSTTAGLNYHIGGIGTKVVGSDAAPGNPGPSGTSSAVSPAQSLPSDGLYVITARPVGGTTNPNAAVVVTGQLQVRWQ